MTPGLTLRVMTWNIHGGVCAAGRYDLGRAIEVVRRHAPDLVAIQEVEGRDRPGRSSTGWCWAAWRRAPRSSR